MKSNAPFCCDEHLEQHKKEAVSRLLEYREAAHQVEDPIHRLAAISAGSPLPEEDAGKWQLQPFRMLEARRHAPARDRFSYASREASLLPPRPRWMQPPDFLTLWIPGAPPPHKFFPGAKKIAAFPGAKKIAAASSPASSLPAEAFRIEPSMGFGRHVESFSPLGPPLSIWRSRPGDSPAATTPGIRSFSTRGLRLPHEQRWINPAELATPKAETSRSLRQAWSLDGPLFRGGVLLPVGRYAAHAPIHNGGLATVPAAQAFALVRIASAGAELQAPPRADPELVNPSPAIKRPSPAMTGGFSFTALRKETAAFRTLMAALRESSPKLRVEEVLPIGPKPARAPLQSPATPCPRQLGHLGEHAALRWRQRVPPPRWQTPAPELLVPALAAELTAQDSRDCRKPVVPAGAVQAAAILIRLPGTGLRPLPATGRAPAVPFTPLGAEPRAPAAAPLLFPPQVYGRRPNFHAACSRNFARISRFGSGKMLSGSLALFPMLAGRVASAIVPPASPKRLRSGLKPPMRYSYVQTAGANGILTAQNIPARQPQAWISPEPAAVASATPQRIATFPAPHFPRAQVRMQSCPGARPRAAAARPVLEQPAMGIDPAAAGIVFEGGFATSSGSWEVKAPAVRFAGSRRILPWPHGGLRSSVVSAVNVWPAERGAAAPNLSHCGIIAPRVPVDSRMVQASRELPVRVSVLPRQSSPRVDAAAFLGKAADPALPDRPIDPPFRTRPGADLAFGPPKVNASAAAPPAAQWLPLAAVERVEIGPEPLPMLSAAPVETVTPPRSMPAAPLRSAGETAESASRPPMPSAGAPPDALREAVARAQQARSDRGSELARRVQMAWEEALWPALNTKAGRMGLAVCAGFLALLFGIHAARPAIGSGLNSLLKPLNDRSYFLLEEGFDKGFNNWTNPGLMTPSQGGLTELQRGLTLYRPSLHRADYEFTFSGLVRRGALGWVVRAADSRNYYAFKLAWQGRGKERRSVLLRYPVANGASADKPQAVPLPFDLIEDKLYRVTVDAAGGRITTMINDRGVDSCADANLKLGGVGFFADAGDEEMIQSLSVSGNDDGMGRLIYWFKGFGAFLADKL
jgi:hypothetical protein